MRVLSNVEAANQSRSVKCRAYLHNDKYDVLDGLVDAGLKINVEARAGLVYALHETEIDFWVNLDTGVVTLDGVQ